jgi:hypothetical protein
MFDSIDTSGKYKFCNLTFGDNGKGKVKGLGKMVISNVISTSNVLVVEPLNFNLCQQYLGFKCIFGVVDVEIISADGSNSYSRVSVMNLYLVYFDSREAQLLTCLF